MSAATAPLQNQLNCAMRIAAWVITILLFIAGIACIIDALTTSYGVWRAEVARASYDPA